MKNTRGVQQEDVNHAADALIAEGLRPTIERVRQKIGKGSPNTVSPFLDVWFATLAGRLGVGDRPQGDQNPPEVVQKVALSLWNAALLSAGEEVARELGQVRKDLAEDRMTLDHRETELQRQQQALTAKQLAMDETLQMARSQLTEMTARLELSSNLVSQRDSQIDEFRAKLEVLGKEHWACVQRGIDENTRQAEERSRLEARAVATENRLLQELQQERQEAGRIKSAMIEKDHLANEAYDKLEAVNGCLVKKLQEIESELKAGKLALATVESHASELSRLLESQKLTHAATLKQLDLLLTPSARKMLERQLYRRRRI